MGIRAQAIALERLKAKLVVLAEERQLAEVAELRGDAVKAEWGQQVNPRFKMTSKWASCLAPDPVLNKPVNVSLRESKCTDSCCAAGQGTAGRIKTEAACEAPRCALCRCAIMCYILTRW